MINTNIPAPGEIPEEGVDFHAEFRRKSFVAWRWLKDFADAMRTVVLQINTTSTEINARRNDTLNARNEAVSATESAVAAESAIKGYVIPTNATIGLDDYNTNLAEIVRVATAQSIQISILANQHKG